MVRLAVYDPASEFYDNYPESLMDLGKFLQERPSWKPPLEDTYLIFDFLTEEQNMEINPFGLLQFLWPQLDEAAHRLRDQEFALLRSAGDWTASFYIFEPQGETTLFSMLGQIPPPLNQYYPLGNSPLFLPDKSIDQRAALYTFVTENKKKLPPDDAVGRLFHDLQDIPLPTEALTTGMTHSAEMGKRFIKELKPFA